MSSFSIERYSLHWIYCELSTELIAVGKRSQRSGWCVSGSQGLAGVSADTATPQREEPARGGIWGREQVVREAERRSQTA